MSPGLRVMMVAALALVGCVPGGPRLRGDNTGQPLGGLLTSYEPGVPDPDSGCLGLGLPTGPQREGVFEQLNAYRGENNLAPLRYSLFLEAAADAHARDMAARGFFSHYDPQGVSPGDRALDHGFCHQYGGENISMGLNAQSLPAEVMAGWKTSPGHNSNMLSEAFVYVGVGYFQRQVEGGVEHYWVQHFGAEQSP